MTRSNNRWYLQTLLACFFLAGNAAAQKKQQRPPNIIFILADDQGYGDLGAFFQNERARLKDPSKPFELSPHTDRMAAEGTMLTQYYVAAPICAPSRASLMLGVSQGHANVRDNEFDKALDDNYTMPGALRKLGYSTAIIGKWGLEGNDKYDLNGYQWPARPLRPCLPLILAENLELGRAGRPSLPWLRSSALCVSAALCEPGRKDRSEGIGIAQPSDAKGCRVRLVTRRRNSSTSGASKLPIG